MCTLDGSGCALAAPDGGFGSVADALRVARAAAARDPAVPVIAVAGRCTLTPGELRAAGIARAYALSDLEPDLERCIADAGPLVERLAGRIAADWLS